jgi:hypothetical protein
MRSTIGKGNAAIHPHPMNSRRYRFNTQAHKVRRSKSRHCRMGMVRVYYLSFSRHRSSFKLAFVLCSAPTY